MNTPISDDNQLKSEIINKDEKLSNLFSKILDKYCEKHQIAFTYNDEDIIENIFENSNFLSILALNAFPEQAYDNYKVNNESLKLLDKIKRDFSPSFVKDPLSLSGYNVIFNDNAMALLFLTEYLDILKESYSYKIDLNNELETFKEEIANAKILTPDDAIKIPFRIK